MERVGAHKCAAGSLCRASQLPHILRTLAGAQQGALKARQEHCCSMFASCVSFPKATADARANICGCSVHEHNREGPPSPSYVARIAGIHLAEMSVRPCVSPVRLCLA